MPIEYYQYYIRITGKCTYDFVDNEANLWNSTVQEYNMEYRKTKLSLMERKRQYY